MTTKDLIAHVTVTLAVLGAVLAIIALMTMPLWGCAL